MTNMLDKCGTARAEQAASSFIMRVALRGLIAGNIRMDTLVRAVVAWVVHEAAVV